MPAARGQRHQWQIKGVHRLQPRPAPGTITPSTTLSPRLPPVVTLARQISFDVLYGSKPFAIIEDYAPNPDASTLGAYNKTVEEPLGKLLKLPTVFVNVTSSGPSDAYDTCMLFSCKGDVIELNLASRSSSMDGSQLAAMLQLAHSMNVPFEPQDVKYVEWAACPQ